MNLGSCNGCDIEFLAAMAGREGIELVHAGAEADLVLLTGALTERNACRLAAEDPQSGVPVLYVGTCAITQGTFSPPASHLRDEPRRREGRAIDVFGCPPGPRALLRAIAAITGKEVATDGEA